MVYNMRIQFIQHFLFLAISSILVLACQDGDKEQAVDLGVSVLWSSHNLGAESETGYGWYLAWGETEEKDHYFYDNYQYTDSEESQTTLDIGETICGTEYDMATTIWNEGWRLPSEVEIMELIESCDWSWEERDGIVGVKVLGPSGRSIFLPAGGTNKEIPDDDYECAYWTGTLSQEGFGRTAVSLLCIYDAVEEETTLRTFGTYKINGLLVRPVKDK